MSAATVEATQSGAQNSGQSQITDELVREVADKVFAMMLLELRIEQERRHRIAQGAPLSKGGR